MQVTLAGLAVTLSLLTLGLCLLVYPLLRQHGRLLMRLDQVERRLGLDSGDALARGSVAVAARTPEGLPPGTLVPAFRLPDLEGREVALADLRGWRVLLVGWSARCGYCARIAPDLAGLEPALAGAGVRLVLVSAGPALEERELVREHGLESPVLLAGRSGLEALAGVGTPSAYLLDEEGRVAAPLAVGADRVLALARSQGRSPAREARSRRLPGERPLSESRIERQGLRAGVPAPAFELPSLAGGTVSLAAHRGRKVLLVFSDPHCGPCDELAPHLVRLHAEHRDNGMDLLLVGRGDPAENQGKAAAHGYEFPVAVQHRWELSKQYGIFSTPVAFLIDEEGVIARDVARGTDEILALAAEARKERVHERSVG
jgi:peroxiredoxin